MTATAGDDATPSTSGASTLTIGPLNAPTYTVPIDVACGGVTGMLYDVEPWCAPHRNPMPTLAPFPRFACVESIVRQAAREAHWRCRNAWRALRGDEWPDW